MSLQLPVLDDTDFEALSRGALQYLDDKLDVEWTAAPEGDPGRMLIEAMAYLTDQTVYRLNRLPLKIYIAFLRLLGHTPYPPTAAEVRLKFELQEGIEPVEGAKIEIPRGTRVSTEEGSGGDNAPVFVTQERLELPLAASAAAAENLVRARHCTWVQMEDLGLASGLPGLTVAVAQPPIVFSWGHREFEVRVWVETAPEEGGQPHPDRPDDPRTYLEWQETPGFANHGAGDALRALFTVDRLSGTIRFAPAARVEIELDADGTVLDSPPQPLASVPGKDAQILVSYASGGGTAGNVLPGTLTRILDSVHLIAEPVGKSTVTSAVRSDEYLTVVRADEYLTVVNPERAEGGQEAETIENALLRGPLALYTREQAVTARDYERVIRRAAATVGTDQIARVRALTQAARWAYAKPGTVEVQLVPRLPPGEKLTLGLLRQLAEQVDLAPIQAALAERAAIGTRADLQWATYKPVQVKADLVVDEESESRAIVVATVRERLEQYINPFHNPDRPLADPRDAGWPFGRSLRLDEVEQVIKKASGMVQIRDLTLRVPAPNADVRSLAPDPYQPDTWYAGSRGTLYRSLNDGLGWEEMHVFVGETIRAIRPNPDRPGLLALVTTVDAPVLDAGAGEPAQNAGAGLGPSPGAPSAAGEPAQNAEAGLRPSPDAPQDDDQEPLSSARSKVYASTDCGRTWAHITDFNYPMADLGWLLRANLHILLLATDRGLYEFELILDPDAPHLDVPTLVPVDPERLKAPLYALTVVRGRRGQARVAVALKSRGGVFLSEGADLVPDDVAPMDQDQIDDLVTGPKGRPFVARPQPPDVESAGPHTVFRRVPALDGQDVRHLAAQQAGVRSYLWAGTMAKGNEAEGCYRWRIDRAEGRWFSEDWQGGSCRALAFDGAWAYAATQWGGVLKLDLRTETPGDWAPRWQESTQHDTEHEPSFPKGFMRFRDDQREDYEPDYRHYKPLWALGVGSSGTVMAGGEAGILRRVPPVDESADAAASAGDLYEESSCPVVDRHTYHDEITLPYNGLFVLDGEEKES